MSEEKKHDSRQKFLLAGVLGSVLSSIAWVTEQEAITRLSALTVAAVAPLVASLLMAPFTLRYHTLPSRESFRRMAGPFLVVLLLRNIFGSLVFTAALVMTSSAKVMFLTKIEPYLVLFLHWVFYKERVPQRDLMLLLVHVFGAIILSTGGEFRLHIEQVGDVLVLLGILGNALTYRPGKQLAEALGPAVMATIGSFLAGILLLPFALYWHSEDFLMSAEHTVGFSYLLLTVVIFYIISSTLWFYSLQGVDAWLNSALRCVGPVVAAPIAWFAFGKVLTGSQAIGAAIVILTSLLLVRSSGKSAGTIQKASP